MYCRVNGVGIQPVLSAEECKILSSIVADGERDISAEDRADIERMVECQ